MNREQKSGGVGCFIMGMVGFMLLPLYVFSIGPATWLVIHYPQSQSVLSVIYHPLGEVAAHWQQFHEFLNWYADLWV